jgi:hypothetical protein
MGERLLWRRGGDAVRGAAHPLRRLLGDLPVPAWRLRRRETGRSDELLREKRGPLRYLELAVSPVRLPLGVFLGGFVVGGVVRWPPPGLHGALSGALVAAVALAWSSASTIAILMDPVSDTPLDDAERFLVLAVGLCVLSPIAILAGYLGGKLGGLLRRSRVTSRSAS